MPGTFAPLTGKRGLIVLSVALLAVGVVLTTTAVQRDTRARRLADEINSQGGDCRPTAPASQWLRYWRGEVNRPMPVDVLLDGSHFTSSWLGQNDSLSDLRIDRLSIYESPVTGDDVRSISQRHPLRYLKAFHLERADSAASGDWQVGEIEQIDLPYSDLTDEGLRQLPLERIVSLRIANTRVTATGLQELSRCTKLVELMLDGRQFDTSVAMVLNSLPTFFGLSLDGPTVTDDHIRLLHSMPRVDSVTIEAASTTHAAIAEYAAARPECVLFVDGEEFSIEQ